MIKSLGRGGAEMLLVETLKLHDRDQFDFHYIYFLPWKDQLVEGLSAEGGKVSCIAANNNIQIMMRVWAVVRYVRTNKIRIIHAHLPWAGVLARLVGRITGTPVLYTEHNKQERYHFATRLINLATMPLLTSVIAVSDDVCESIKLFKRNLSTPVVTIPNGVNTRHFRPFSDEAKNDARRDQSIAQDSVVIGTIAVFRSQKRLELWLEIASKIVAHRHNAYFIIVGDGPFRQRIVNKISELGLSHNILIAGLQQDVRPYLASMDIYMMSSIFEGLPVALLEAMACGLPVVTTDAGGIKQVVRDGEDGLVCPVAKATSLVDLAITLIDHQAQRVRFGGNARRRIEETFSLDRMVMQVEKLYRHVAGENPQ